MTPENENSIGSLPISDGDNFEEQRPLAPEDRENVPPNSPTEQQPVSFPRKKTGKTRKKTGEHKPKRWLKFFAIIILLAVSYIPFGYFAVPQLCKTLLPNLLTKKIHRPVTIGGAAFDPFSLTLVLRNGIIGPDLNNPDDKIDPLLSFQSILLDLSPVSLYRLGIVCQQFEMNHFFLHLSKDKTGTYNVARIFENKQSAQGKNNLFGLIDRIRSSTVKFSCRDISIADSRIVFDDLPADKTHHIEEINITLPAFSNFPSQLFPGSKTASVTGLTTPSFSARFDGSPINLTGETEIVDGFWEARLDLSLKKLDLAQFAQYLPVDRENFLITKGTGNLDLQLVFSSNPETKDPLVLEGSADLNDIWLQSKKSSFAKIARLSAVGTIAPLSSNYNFQRVIATAPQVHVERLTQDLWDFPGADHNRVAANDKNGSHSRTADKKPPYINLQIADFRIVDGKLSFVDRQIRGGFAESFEDFQVEIKDFSLKDGNAANLTLNARAKEESRLAFQGSLSASPFSLKGMLIANQINLNRISPYMSDFSVDIKIKSGLLNTCQSRLAWHKSKILKQNQIILTETSADISNLQLVKLEDEILRLPAVSMKNSSLDFTNKKIDLGLIELSHASLAVSDDTIGSINWPKTLPAKGKNDVPEWDISLQAVQITNSTVLYTPASDTQTLPIKLDRLSLQLINISNQLNHTGTATGFTRINNKALFRFSGTFGINPLQAVLDSSLDDFQLTDIPESFYTWLTPAVTSGNLTAKGKINLPDLKFDGAATIENFTAATPSDTLIQWYQATTENMQFTTNPFFLSIDKCSVVKPFMKWIIYNKDDSSLKHIFSPSSPENQTADDATVSLDNIRINNGTLSITDRSINPNYQTSINNVTGTITNLKNIMQNRSHITLQGMIDNESPIDIDGNFGFFEKQFSAAFNTRISNLTLSEINQYIEPELGYQVKEGKMDITTSYSQDNGIIKAVNSVHLSNFELGKNIKGNQTLPLTLALLTDTKGNIHFDLPVTGSAEDPSFSYRTSLMQVFRNLLLKTTVSPFSLLNTILPGKNTLNLDQITFPFGSAEISGQNMDMLQELAQIMKQRPKLRIQIQAFADLKGDREALKSIKMQEAIQNKIDAEAQLSKQLSTQYGNEEIQLPEGFEQPAGSPEEFMIKNEVLVQLARQRLKNFRDTMLELGIDATRMILNSNIVLVPADSSGRPGNRVDITLDTIWNKIGIK